LLFSTTVIPLKFRQEKPLEIQNVWDVTRCRLVNSYWLFGGTTILRALVTLYHSTPARRLVSSSTWVVDLKILHESFMLFALLSSLLRKQVAQDCKYRMTRL